MITLFLSSSESTSSFSDKSTLLVALSGRHRPWGRQAGAKKRHAEVQVTMAETFPQKTKATKQIKNMHIPTVHPHFSPSRGFKFRLKSSEDADRLILSDPEREFDEIEEDRDDDLDESVTLGEKTEEAFEFARNSTGSSSVFLLVLFTNFALITGDDIE